MRRMIGSAILPGRSTVFVTIGALLMILLAIPVSQR
jgi:hypothetical protein